jgi:DNA repair protein RadC
VSWWRPKAPEMPVVLPTAPDALSRRMGFSEAAIGAAMLDARAPAASTPGDVTPPSPHAAFPSTGPHGHRSRMRDKLLNRGPDALADYELLEMLLFYAMPKGDTKPLAKALINRFGSFAAVLAAPPKDLFAVPGLAEFGVSALKLVQASALRLAKAELTERPILNNWDRLTDYLNAVLGRDTVNHTPVYPREILKRALELHAMAIILVHNHPSGDPSPSDDDIVVTREIKAAANMLQIALHDHVIVGNGRCFSLRSNGLM